MRKFFDEQLEFLHKELIQMGAMCEQIIDLVTISLKTGNKELVKKIKDLHKEIQDKKQQSENICIKLILQQQPVARDLRTISATLKIISDMGRIGDQTEDVAEIFSYIEDCSTKEYAIIVEMARATSYMIRESIIAFVNQEIQKAKEVVYYDDTVDNYFIQVRKSLIELISLHPEQGEYALDLFMIAKYFERIGDHGSKIARWVLYSVVGQEGLDDL